MTSSIVHVSQRSHDIPSVKMASQTTGIQQLLGAEKRAAEKVAEARKRKCDEGDKCLVFERGL